MSLTPELERFVGEKVESGLYNNASAVVREGLRLLKEQDEVRLRWREQIERGWQEAQADVWWTATRRFDASMAGSRRPPHATQADGGVRLTPSAEEHIGDIVEFIATDNEDAAVRVRHPLYSAFDLLASRPGVGHLREDLTDRPLKFWSVYSYWSCTSLPLIR